MRFGFYALPMTSCAHNALYILPNFIIQRLKSGKDLFTFN